MRFPLGTQVLSHPTSYLGKQPQEEVFHVRLSLSKSQKHNKVTQVSVSDFHSPYLLHYFFSFIRGLWLHGEFPITKWQDKKNSGLVYRWFYMICWHYFNVDDHSIVVPLEDNFEGEPWKKIHQSAELQVVYLVVTSACKEWWQEVWIYIDSHVMAEWSET